MKDNKARTVEVLIVSAVTFVFGFLIGFLVSMMLAVPR